MCLESAKEKELFSEMFLALSTLIDGIGLSKQKYEAKNSTNSEEMEKGKNETTSTIHITKSK